MDFFSSLYSFWMTWTKGRGRGEEGGQAGAAGRVRHDGVRNVDRRGEKGQEDVHREWKKE